AEFMSYAFSVPTAGTYPLHLWYASGESPQFGIMVNGVLQTASAVGTNSWSGPFVETTVSVNLNAGANTIQLQGTSAGHAFALDKLCITSGTTSTTVTGSNCGNTPQNYCWTSAIPAGQIMFRTAAVEVVAGPKSANDSGNAPASGNCWCIQQYAGQPNCYIYPTSTKDMLLPVSNTPTATQYRVTVGTGQTGKTAKLYVNGTLSWSKTVTDGELLYPDFTSVTAQSRVYFVIESGSARMGEGHVETSEETLATVVYPNPTVDVVKVVYYLAAAETVQYSLINSEGNLLLNKLTNGTAGQNQLEIDMKANPSGVYFLRLQSTQKNETIKVIRGK
ncbi:T9SS type A sorting domain-containing protein, partial [Spirosoma endophyticum]